MAGVSIITIATSDPEKVAAFIVRIDAIFKNDHSLYEVIFLDNNHSDVNQNIIEQSGAFPLKLVTDDYSFNSLKFKRVAFLLDFIEYPPETLPGMIDTLSNRDILAVAAIHKTARLWSIWHDRRSSKALQASPRTSKQLDKSKLIVCKSKALAPYKSLRDLDISKENLLTRIADRKYALAYISKSHNRPTERRSIMSLESIKRLIVRDHYKEFDNDHTLLRGKGFYYKGTEYVTHNTLLRKRTAIERTTVMQRVILAFVIALSITAIILNVQLFIMVVITIVTTLYFCDLLFNLFLIYRSFKSYSEIKIDDSSVSTNRDWPVYTILCPLYKELLVLPQFVAAMQSIDYPDDKREVLLLLEQDDKESISAIHTMGLPSYFKMIVVPDSMPRTKPKACNYGLLHAGGDYTVIYDAEDIPDPLQLKKAVLAFEQGSEDIGCIQAKLNYYNWDQNLLTRLFTLEYSLWFNLILTGLQSIKAPIPLGGTSNHFRTKILRDLGGWDPFNVTEDADLGIRLAKRGLKTAVLDSTTLEEANSQVKNWLKQRSRWIKGYMQTYLVHMRDLREFGKNSRHIDMLTFQLVIGGKIVSMLINPLLWIMTISYFAFRDQVGPTIESLYLAPVFYLGAISLVLGNFMYVYYYMMGAAREGRPELIIFAAFVPAYWIMMSIAAYYALYDLIIRPFHWHKTKHGLHLKKIATKI